MKELVTYILGVVVCSGVFSVFYRTVLHRHVSFRTARRYLLASLVVAAVIPAFEIPVWNVAPIEIPLITAAPTTSATPAAAPATDWRPIALWSLYGLGIAVLAVAMARQIARIARMKKRAEVLRTDAFEVALSEEIDAPFSFLGTVFIERGTPDEETRQIMLHEASHIRHRHSAEKIAMEVLKAAMWFNPFAWWTASLLGEVHEFEADRDVLDGGATVEEYLPLILRRTLGYNPELSLGLGDSLTKKRFLMMKNKMKLTRFSWLRVAGVLPLAAGMMLLFSFTSLPPEIIYTEAPAAVETPVAVESPVAEIVPVPEPVADEMLIEPAAEVAAPAAQEPQKEVVHEFVDTQPAFQGGVTAMNKWLADNLRYPVEASKNGISGTVVMQFTVGIDGSLYNFVTLASPDRSLTEEAMRMLSISPKWVPGVLNGKSVASNFRLPVKFVMYDDAPVEKPAESADEVVRPTPPTSEETSGEDEIVVVGYGTQRKGNAEVTGEWAGGAFTGNAEASESNQPLYILDGEEITKEQMDALDTNTIDSVFVFKNASATAQYGEKGKDGVVVITLKK
jgi:TonB family protein